jgi:hypothetical protein
MSGNTAGPEPDYKLIYSDGTTGYGDLYTPEDKTDISGIADAALKKGGSQTDGGVVFVRWGVGTTANLSWESFAEKIRGKLGGTLPRNVQSIVIFDGNFNILDQIANPNK